MHDTIRNMKMRSASSAQMSKQRICSLFQLTLATTVIVFMGGAVALLWQLQQGHLAGATASIANSADVSVVGPPSLPAVTVDTIFKGLGSPMLGTGKVVEQASRQANIDDAFALAVWWTETNDGAAGVGRADLNPGSVRGSTGYPSAYDGYTIYPSYTAAINYWFYLLKNRYVNLGLSMVYSISHPYVGTSSSPLWAGKVIALMLRYRGEAPPPTITHHPITPTPIPARQPGLQKIASANTDAVPLSRQDPVGSSVATRLATPLQPGTSPLSPATELAIACFALLTALAIALWALKITQNLPVSSPQSMLLITPIPTHSPLRLPSQNPVPHPPIRRIILLPTLPDTAIPGEAVKIPVATSTRSTGLLSGWSDARNDGGT